MWIWDDLMKIGILNDFNGFIFRKAWFSPSETHLPKRSFCRSQDRVPGSRPMAPKTMLKFSCEWSVTWESIRSFSMVSEGIWWLLMIRDLQYAHTLMIISLKQKTWLSNTFDLTAILTVFECVWLWLQHSLNLLETSMPCSICQSFMKDTAPPAMPFRSLHGAPWLLTSLPCTRDACRHTWQCSHHGRDDPVASKI